MKPHQERVVAEKAELDSKLIKLNSFVNENPAFASLIADEQMRLRRQAEIMFAYSEILRERIDAFTV